MTATPRRSAIVLCGGDSSRMGRDKAALPFGRGTLLSRAVAQARRACDEVLVVLAAGAPPRRLPRGARRVRDRAPGRGPLEGLAAGLAAARAPVAVVLPCDAPFLAPALIEALFAALERDPRADAAVPLVRGRPEPLPSAYRVRLAPRARALVDGGARRLLALAGDAGAVRLGAREVRRADPGLDSFRDCDTPAAYRAARRLESDGYRTRPTSIE